MLRKLKKAISCFLYLIFILFLISVSYSHASNIEGTVKDETGKPVHNVKVVAIQEMPLKGYAKVECVTAENGEFILKKLYPLDNYKLFIDDVNWESIHEISVLSAPKGETRLIMDPVVVRKIRIYFINENMFIDKETDLEWFIGPNRYMTIEEARTWAKSLDVKGGRWRLPTIRELQKLYETGVHLKRKGCCVWSSESQGGFKLSYAFDLGRAGSWAGPFQAYAVRIRTD